jgi:DNA-binding transcriptional regulator YiaG
MTFSETIKQIRQKHFLSQEAFAKELGVSFATVNRWESGKTKPTYKTMKLIDDYCRKNSIDFDITKELETTAEV